MPILGAKDVSKKLKWLGKQSRRHNNVGVIVGYTASYASWVHENIEMKWRGKPRGSKNPRKSTKGQRKKGRYWDPQGRGQAKFLEQPFREFHGELVDIVYRTTKTMNKPSNGKGLDIGLMLAGLRLQRESQLLVPVDTGNLKASAFTRLIHDNKGKG